MPVLLVANLVIALLLTSTCSRRARPRRRLVRANWVRTGAWTARAGLLVWLAGRC
jgi:hypothetical protein